MLTVVKNTEGHGTMGNLILAHKDYMGSVCGLGFFLIGSSPPLALQVASLLI